MYDDGGDEIVQVESVVNNSVVGDERRTTESQQNDQVDPLMPVQPPMINTFLIAQQNRMLKEFGAMLPSKDVYCMPNSKSIEFLK